MKNLSTKKIIAIALAVILAIVAIVVVVKVTGDSPKKAVKSFETAINEKDLDKFIECLPPDTQDELNDVLKTYENLGYDKEDYANEFFADFAEDEDGESFDVEDLKVEIKIKKVKKDGDKATVTCDLKVKNGKEVVNEEEDQEIPTVKVDKKWYVDLESMK